MKKKLLIFMIMLTFLMSWFPADGNKLHAEGASVNLGVANGFNVFVFNNHYHKYSDAEGRVAVGNEAKYINYSISSALEVSANRYDLIVGKKMNIEGAETNGNTAIGTNGIIDKYTMNNKNGVKENPFSEDVVDFEQAYNSLSGTSKSWANLSPNATVANQYGTLKFVGADRNLNIFSVKASELEKASYIDFDIPQGSTLLINVSGSSFTLTNKAINLPVSSYNKTMWNFYECEKMNMGGIQFNGSILAPDCTFTASGSGQINGTVVFKDFYNWDVQGFEAHNYPFNSKIPTDDDDTPTGFISLKKVDAETKEALAGAKFKLTNTETQKEYGPYSTDQEGNLSFTNLPYGTYSLQETEAPKGYVLDKKQRTFVIGEGEEAKIDYQEEIKNQKAEEPTGSITLKKIDAETKEALAEAEFKLTNTGTGKEYGPSSTNEEGNLSFNNLPYGTYSLQETKAPKGYVLDEKPQIIVIGEGEGIKVDHELTIKNRAKQSIIESIDNINDKAQGSISTEKGISSFPAWIEDTSGKIREWIDNPKTGQESMNILLIGSLFVLSGGGIYLFRRFIK